MASASSLEDSPILGTAMPKSRFFSSQTDELQQPASFDHVMDLGLALDSLTTEEEVSTPALSTRSASSWDSPMTVTTPPRQHDKTQEAASADQLQAPVGLGIDPTAEFGAVDLSCMKKGVQLTQDNFENFQDHKPLSLSRSPSASSKDKNRRRASFFNMASLSFGTRNKRVPSALTSTDALTSICESSASIDASPTAPASQRGTVKRLTRTLSNSAASKPSSPRSSTASARSFRLPSFPCRLDELASHQERCEFLKKHQILNFALGKRHGSFRPRLLSLCKSSTGNQISLHVFKSNQPDDVEVERMQLKRSSVCHVTSEIPGGRLYVLKVTGSVRGDNADKEEAWFFSMNDQMDLSDWMHTLKAAISQVKAGSSTTSTPLASAASIRLARSYSSLSPTRESPEEPLRLAAAAPVVSRYNPPGRVSHPFATMSDSDKETIAWPDLCDESLKGAQTHTRPRGISNESTFAPFGPPRTSVYSFFGMAAVVDDAQLHEEEVVAKRLRSASVRASFREPASKPPSVPLPALPTNGYQPQLSPNLFKSANRHSMYSFTSEASTPSESSTSSSVSLFSKSNRASTSSCELSEHSCQSKAPCVPPRSPLRDSVAHRLASIESQQEDFQLRLQPDFTQGPLPPLPVHQRKQRGTTGSDLGNVCE